MAIMLVIAFLLTISLVFLLKMAAAPLALIDRPDARKQHQGEIPVVGGIAMFLSLLLVTAFFLHTGPSFKGFLGGCFLLVLCGALDDRFLLSHQIKLCVEILVVLVMLGCSHLAVYRLGALVEGREILLTPLQAHLFTIFCIVGLINAVNMMDGIDGLAGGIALASFVTLAAAAFLAHLPLKAPPLLVIAAITGGFLTFNIRHPWRKRAAVFMGDAGSMMLGFALAWFAVDLTQPSAHPPGFRVPPITVVWIIGLPLLDASTVIMNRIMQRKSPFVAGRDHVYHLLQAMGLSDAVVTFLLVTFSVCLGLVGLIGWYCHVSEHTLFYAFVLLAAFYAFLQSWLRYQTGK